MDLLSGFQKGDVAPSVPGSACASVCWSRRRNHSRDASEPEPEATKTILRPSGDSANDSGDIESGVAISSRHSDGVAGGFSRKCTIARDAKAKARSPVVRIH